LDFLYNITAILENEELKLEKLGNSSRLIKYSRAYSDERNRNLASHEDDDESDRRAAHVEGTAEIRSRIKFDTEPED
jgi:hypothetical protein